MEVDVEDKEDDEGGGNMLIWEIYFFMLFIYIDIVFVFIDFYLLLWEFILIF